MMYYYIALSLNFLTLVLPNFLTFGDEGEQGKKKDKGGAQLMYECDMSKNIN